MIHIKTDRCGYTGYRCSGIGVLDKVFTTSVMSCDSSERNRREGSFLDEAKTENTIDNYYSLPRSFKGFVMTLDRLTDVSETNFEVVEKSCRVNFDPFVASGRFDAYGSMKATGVLGKMSRDPGFSDLSHRLLCDRPDPEETRAAMNQFEPGILEPMLDTMFKPVGVDVNTAFDASLDGIMLTLVLLTKWRIKVDEKLNELAAAFAHLWAMRNLLKAMHMKSICDQFQIKLTSGQPLFWSLNRPAAPTYSISGGSVMLNGEPLTYVNGIAELPPPPFKVLLVITLSGCSDKTEGQYSSASAYLTTSAEKGGPDKLVIGIGGVREVFYDKKFRKVHQYHLYEIYQERCEVDVEMVRTCDEGVLYRLRGGASPFKVLKLVDCEGANLG